MLKLREDIHVPHNFSKNISVRKETSFGDLHLLAFELVEFGPFFQPCHECKDLESEAPALWISVVELQEINSSLRPNLLPGSERLVKDSELREVLFDYL